MKEINTSLKKLNSKLKGELHSDSLSQGIYATDASNYQIMPAAVALPKDEEDVRLLVNFALENQLPVLARGGGTSLVGQTVGEGLVIDFTKYMDQVLELNVEEQWAWVQPGIVRDVLNQQLTPHGLHFAPDPATSSRATVGGMIANNSSGTRSILYGKTIDHVLELRILLADGSLLHCKELSPETLEKTLESEGRISEIYRNLFRIVEENRSEIATRFPKVMRRVGGYNLDEFLDGRWNLSRIITGSESTLGIILSAKIRLVPNPKFQSLCIVHFHDFFDSIAHVAEMVRFNPASVELLDRMLIEKSRENMETRRYCGFIEGNPGGALVVEFFSEQQSDATNKAEELALHLKNKGIGYAWPVIADRAGMEAVFTVRKKGLGLLMGVKGKRKPIAFIEDAAVPLESLPAYIKEVFDCCHAHEVPVVAYAHASVGLLHVKPLLDLRDPADIERMKQISLETLELVKKYKGSWSGEHGDGLARSPYNLSFFGERLYKAFVEVKRIFDPSGIMNPGKIVDAPPVDQHLRYGPDYKDGEYKSMFSYRQEGGFADAVHLCNGVGECRKTSGGTMCPSYRATREEKDTTRARANLLRLAMSNQLDEKGLESPLLSDVMDLCLSCKACKSECPSNVDMSKLKSEVQYIQKKKHGLGIADRLILMQDNLGKWNSGRMAPLVNGFLRRKFIRFLLEKWAGIDKRRILPEYTKHPFESTPNSTSAGEKPQVVLFADTYMKYHDSAVGFSARTLLERCGFQVHVFSQGCCQRPAISHGLLDQARQRGESTFRALKIFLDQKIPVVVCEPSCATALRDDLPDLLEDPQYARYADQIFLLEDFILNQKKSNNSSIRIKPGHYLLHGHCHQKAVFTTKALHALFSDQDNVSLEELQTGCCGMAGSFGYEKEHYEISEQISNMALIPGIKERNPDSRIIATGFSCRHQIAHFADKTARHWVEYLEF